MAIFTTVVYSLTRLLEAIPGPVVSHMVKFSTQNQRIFPPVHKNGEFSKFWWASDLGKNKSGILPSSPMSK